MVEKGKDPSFTDFFTLKPKPQSFNANSF